MVWRNPIIYRPVQYQLETCHLCQLSTCLHCVNKKHDLATVPFQKRISDCNLVLQKLVWNHKQRSFYNWVEEQKCILRERTLKFGKTEPMDKHPEATVIVWVHICRSFFHRLPCCLVWREMRATFTGIHFNNKIAQIFFQFGQIFWSLATELVFMVHAFVFCSNFCKL